MKKKNPFFEKFLENQLSKKETKVSKGGRTLKFPHDGEEHVTMKWPSDDDEDIPYLVE